MRVCALSILAALLAIGLAAPNASLATSYQVVALQNASAGVGNGVYYDFGDPVLNDQGRVAFDCYTSNFLSGRAIALPESAHIVALEGLAAPDMPAGVTFDQLGFKFSLRLNNENQIAFTGDVVGTGITSQNDSAIWAGAPESLHVVAQTNDLAPSAGGAHFTKLDDSLGFGKGGFVGFTAVLDDGKTGIWAGTDNNVQLVALEGAAAPGLAGYQYGKFLIFGNNATLNNQQRLTVFSQAKQGTHIVNAIWSGTPGNVQLVANEGMPISGFAPDTQIRFLHTLGQINDDNEVAFSASIGPPAGSVSDTILLKTPSGISAMYDPAGVPPGFAAGTSYGTQSDFYLGKDRRVVFLNQVKLPNSSFQWALFASDNGAVRQVARANQQIPNVQQNLHFTDFAQYYVNDAGRVAFLANVAGDAFQEGIWVEDAAHQLHEVVRTGMQIQLAPGDVRTLTDIDWPDSGFRDFSPLLPYNAAGQIVFQATFGTFNAVLLYNPLLPGDYNGNGTVDTADFIVWRNSVGQSGMGLAADGDDNTMIDGNDYAIWKSHFGQTSFSTAAGGSTGLTVVPEPATAGLITATVFGLVAVSSRRCRSGRNLGLS